MFQCLKQLLSQYIKSLLSGSNGHERGTYIPIQLQQIFCQQLQNFYFIKRYFITVNAYDLRIGWFIGITNLFHGYHNSSKELLKMNSGSKCVNNLIKIVMNKVTLMSRYSDVAFLRRGYITQGRSSSDIKTCDDQTGLLGNQLLAFQFINTYQLKVSISKQTNDCNFEMMISYAYLYTFSS